MTTNEILKLNLNNAAINIINANEEIVEWTLTETARMKGDYLDTKQDTALIGIDVDGVEFYWVCDECENGGEVTVRPNGSRYVDSHDYFLDADSGEMYTCGER